MMKNNQYVREEGDHETCTRDNFVSMRWYEFNKNFAKTAGDWFFLCTLLVTMSGWMILWHSLVALKSLRPIFPRNRPPAAAIRYTSWGAIKISKMERPSSNQICLSKYSRLSYSKNRSLGTRTLSSSSWSMIMITHTAWQRNSKACNWKWGMWECYQCRAYRPCCDGLLVKFWSA